MLLHGKTNWKFTYNGQVLGKVGMKSVQSRECEPDTPPSPEAKNYEIKSNYLSD